MDEKTLTALRQSIEKWERNAVAEVPMGFTIMPQSCPLCQRFWKRYCAGCPVTGRTGKVGCAGSPYAEAAVAADEWLDNPDNDTLRDTAHAAARAEAEFLRSLLPEEEAAP